MTPSGKLSLLLLAIFQPATGFVVPATARIATSVSIRSATRRAGSPAAVFAEDKDSRRSELEKAWAKYVLLRPDMTFDELKASTQTINFKNGRTPGTTRTVLISSVLLILFAIPAIVTNPRVLVWLVELAALDRAGVSPFEFFQQTGSFW